MAFEGIINEQEFYSQHYLDENLLSDIKPWEEELEKKEKDSKAALADGSAKNKEQEWRTPWSRLNAAAPKLLKKISDLENLYGAKSRIEETEQITVELMSLLGLPAIKKEDISAEGSIVPLFSQKVSENGRPYLWVFSAVSENFRDEVTDPDPLNQKVLPQQLINESDTELKEFKDHANDTWLEILSKRVFGLPNAPRWVILTGAEEWVLIDKAKFDQRRVLRFKWKDILSIRNPKVLKVVSYLLGNDAFSEEEQTSRLAELESKSFKHAQGVSEDLKYAMREAVELLGNEAAEQLRKKAQIDKKAFYSVLKAEDLSAECLRYLYRLLFLFFIESRPDLQYAPMSDMHYVDGYSLEFLRDLEMVPLVSTEDQEGRYLHDSIERLFEFFSKGTPRQEDDLLASAGSVELFQIGAVPSGLFDNSKMPLLKNVVFTNKTLQRVIELMSLSRERKGKKFARRGRISYAHLGINQLGAVYETLLSFRGFFAKEDLYEVKRADDKTHDILSPAYFVPASELDTYTEDERVFVTDEKGNKKLRVYPKGTFIYRMAGSERENSASYYTPESLTKCLVKYALQVLEEQQLKDLPDDKAKAERILAWRICEPAMGSAAFINEAVNQTAALYMRYAMKVPGARVLTQSEYANELQKVKMYISDKNIYGVDLNPVAVELAEVSIWLNSVSSDHHIPWFGLQLHCGNSLLGCRRRAYKVSDLAKKGIKNSPLYNFDKEWLPTGYVWQFLLPHPSMSGYNDKTMQSLEDKNFKELKKKVQAFNKIDKSEYYTLELLSMQIDSLWKKWAVDLENFEKNTTDSYTIYEHEDKQKNNLSYEEKQAVLQEAKVGDGSLNSGEFSRIKLVLDYWCSLWGWPIQDADKFPSREEWLRDIQKILQAENQITIEGAQVDLFEGISGEELAKAQNLTDLAKRRKRLGELLPTIGVVNKVSERAKFLHWPLRFAQIFLRGKKENRGFDLTVGNPPWMVVSWEAASVLGDNDPKFVIHDKEYSAKSIEDVIRGKRGGSSDGRTYLDSNPKARKELLSNFENVSLSNIFFNTKEVYPDLEGSQKNLFKAFLPIVWMNASENGVQGILHPETPYTETKGAVLRKALYSRVRKHFHFVNEMKLFPEIGHPVEFSINIFGSKTEGTGFTTITHLYLSETLETCLSDSSSNALALSKKNEKGEWETRGSRSRIIKLDSQSLRKVAEIFGDYSETPKLPYFLSNQAFEVAKKFNGTAANSVQRLASGKTAFVIDSMWHETGAKKDGTIKELPNNETVFPQNTREVILNGPHLAVANPLFKCPRNPCLNKATWDLIDLVEQAEDYLPRVKYLPALEQTDYQKKISVVPWEKEGGRRFDEFFRLAYRAMVQISRERTLYSAIIPPSSAHTNIIQSIAFKAVKELIWFSGAFASLPIDYYVRLQNKGNLQPQLISQIPVPCFSDAQKIKLSARTLVLNCLTNQYSSLWSKSWDQKFQNEKWSTGIPQIDQDFFKNLTEDWTRNCVLRSDLMRRQALVELDVIVAQAFGFTLDDLLFIYSTGFDVMKKYEQGAYYDQNGRIVFTPNSGGLKGAGLPGKPKQEEDISYAKNGIVCEQPLGFQDIKDMESGKVSKTFIDNTQPGGPQKRTIEYVAPFFKMDREEDYRRAWKFFEEEKNEE